MTSSPPSSVPSASPRAARATLVACALYLISGATGLVYEVGWTRRLLLLLGSTSAASALVLSAFLAGLGVGGAWGGRRADRVGRPLALYGALEIVAAAWAAVVPWVLDAIASPYVHVVSGAGPAFRTLADFLATVLVVGPGAFALGATFPALLRAVVPRGRTVGALAPLLYGVNTVGAVAGALWAGFYGVFEVGVLASTRWAAALAAAVGFVAIAVARRQGVATSLSAPSAPSPTGAAGAAGDGPSAGLSRVPRGPLVVAAVSGFLALALEAAGVRILVFFVEGFTASFAAMLAVFLAGLAAGSLLLGAALGRLRSPALVVAALLAATGTCVVLGLFALPRFEDVMRAVRDAQFSAHAPQAAQRWCALAGSSLLFLAPALALGAVYPLCVSWAARGRDARAGGTGGIGPHGGASRDAAPARDGQGDLCVATGAAAGRVALWNGVGALLGPLAVLALGSWSATHGADDTPGGPLLAWALLGLLSIVAAVAIVAAIVVRGGTRRRRAVALAVVVGAGLVAGFASPSVLGRATPEELVLSSRVLRASDGSRDRHRVLAAVVADETTTASVVDLPPVERRLYTDEFLAAATGASYAYMRMLGDLPVLAAASPKNVLVIAFGTGTTAGAVAAHAEVERLEVVETSRAVLSLAPFFEAVNGRVLKDARVRPVVEDGRRALLLHARDLDAITLEPLMPYTPAALPFYTREFYELARSRLRDGGVLAQWIPVHAMPADLYASLVRTFFETFPEGSLWFFEQSTVLVGRAGGAKPDASAVRARADNAAVYRSAGYADAGAFSRGFVASGRRVLEVLNDPSKSSEDAMRAGVGELSRLVVTDERPFPEAYPAPRAGLATSYLQDTLAWLSGLVDTTVGLADLSSSPELLVVDADAFAAARAKTAASLLARHLEAAGDFHAGMRDGAARGSFEGAQSIFDSFSTDDLARDAGLGRRAVRVRRELLADDARRLFRAWDEAIAQHDESAAATAREQALLVTRRSLDLSDADPLLTGRPAAAALHAEALLRAGRCAEAEEVLAPLRALWPFERGLSDLLAVAAAKRRNADPAALPFAARLGRWVGALPPCTEPGLAAARPLLAQFADGFGLGRSDRMRMAGDLLLALHAQRGVTAEALERELAALGDAKSPSSDAERAAVLRRLSPRAPRLVILLRSDDPALWRAAIEASARRGYEALSVDGVVAEAFVGAKDPARRLAFVDWALVEGSRWSLDRLADLLDDVDDGVRRAAWAALKQRLPADRAPSTGYDPASATDRSSSITKVRALLAERK